MLTRILERNDDAEAVSLEEAMEFSRITDSYDELVVQACLDGAHGAIEEYLNRKLVPTTIVGIVDNFRPTITLPYPPIHSIESVTCEDSCGTEFELTESTHYKYCDVSQRVIFLPTFSDAHKYKFFKITFICGYDETEEDSINRVPRSVKHAIRMTFATYYENREDDIIGVNINMVSSPARRVCRAHRVKPV